MTTAEDLPIAATHRIIKKAGAERVSESGAKELAGVLERLGVEIGKEAWEFCMYSGRKTVRGKDIRIAADKVIHRRSR